MRTFEEIKRDLKQAYSIDDVEALLRFAEELDALSTPQAEAEASRSRGRTLFLRDDYPAALSYYHRAIELYEELGDQSMVAVVTGNIGLVHRSTGDYAVALIHFHRALAVHEELGNLRSVAIAAGNIGNVHESTGDYPAAMSHYHRALALHTELGNRNDVATVTGNIGNVYSSIGDYPTALEHYHRALALLEELGERSDLALVTGNVGVMYISIGDFPAALSHLYRSLDLHEELGSRIGVASAMGNIGGVHGSTGDYPAAFDQFHRALALYEELGDRSGVAYVTGCILETMVRTGSDAEAQQLLATMDTMQIDEPNVRIGREQNRSTLQEHSGDLDAAAATLQRALTEAQQHGLRSKSADIHRSLRDLALKQNNLAGYVEHNNEFTRITEEINGKDTATKLAMQVKQREIDAVQREHAQHMAVLHSTLPKHIADRVARGETVNDHYNNAAVIFLDIVGFTTISDQLSSADIVHLLDSVFSALDDVCKNHDVVKIKTIGDSYMAVAFPLESTSSEQRVASPEERAARAALDMLYAVAHILPDLPASLRADLPGGIEVRIGMHSGPVTAGVIGTQRMQYDVWGDTVNVASRMENTSEPGRIHVSSSFAFALSLRHHDSRLQELRQGEVAVIPSVSEEQGINSPFPIPYSLQERGALEIKGKGQMQTYWLMRA